MKLRILLKIIILFCGVYYSMFAQSDGAVQLYSSARSGLYSAFETGKKSDVLSVLTTLQKAYEQNPNFFELIQDIARAYYILGNFGNALKFINRAIALRKNDFAVRILKANILIHQNNFKEARGIIDELTKQDPYDKNLLFIKTVYYVAVNDIKSYFDTVTQMERLFSENKGLFLNTYILLSAMYSGKNTIDSDRAFRYLLQKYERNVWVYFIASKYAVQFNVSIDIKAFSDIFNSSGFNLLSTELLRIQKPLNAKDGIVQNIENKEIIAIKNPDTYTVEDAQQWYTKGIILYERGDVRKAFIALSNAYEINSEDSLIGFVYDAMLKKILEDPEKVDGFIKKQKKERVSFWKKKAQQALSQGDLFFSKGYIRRGLYIDPLEQELRIFLSDILLQEGSYSEAIRELESLASRKKDKNIPILLESIRTIAQNNVETFESTGYRSLMPWNVFINVGQGANKEDEFLTSLLMYTFSKYPYIRVTNVSLLPLSLDNVITVHPYFKRIKDTFIVEVVLKNAITNEQLATVSVSRGGNDNVINGMEEIARRVADMLPIVANILSVNPDKKILIGAGLQQSIQPDIVYALYNKGDVKLSSSPPYFSTTGDHIGYAITNTVELSYSIADISGTFEQSDTTTGTRGGNTPLTGQQPRSLERNIGDKTQIFSDYRVKQNINKNDVIIIPARTWNNDSLTLVNTVANDKNRNNEENVFSFLTQLLFPVW